MNEYKEAMHEVNDYYHQCDYGSLDKPCPKWVELDSLFGIGEFSYCKEHARKVLIKYCIDSGYVTTNISGNVYRHRVGSGKVGVTVATKKPIKCGYLNKNGYIRHNISINSHKSYFFGHHIVWINFNGFIPEGLQVNHKDGNKSNNKLSNLELVTYKENAEHAVNNGLYITGEAHHKTKLTYVQVKEIRSKYIKNKKGYNTISLAKEYGVCRSTMWSVVNNVTWKDVV